MTRKTTRKSSPTESAVACALPKLRFPEFQDAGEWEVRTLGSVCRSFSGGTPSTSKLEYYGGDIPFIRSAEIAGDSTELFLTSEGLGNSAAKMVAKGDVLVALYGANSGDVALARIDGAINQAILCLKSKENNVYIYHYLSFKKDWIVAIYLQGGQGNLSGEIIKSITIRFPSLPEQQKIASCLSSVDELIAAESQLLDALKQHKKGLMQQLFPREGETTPQLRFPEFQDAGEWDPTSLQTIADPITERATQGEDANVLSLSVEHGIVLQSDFFGKKVAGDNSERYLKISRNDFVYNDRTTKASTFGTIKRLFKYSTGIVSPIYKCFRFHEDENPVFWEQYFESGNHDAALRGLVNEGARVGRFNISITQFLSTAAHRPFLPEQQRITDCLSSLDELITAQSEKVEALKTHKKGLMQQLFPNVKGIES